jgi:hypothetical protein
MGCVVLCCVILRVACVLCCVLRALCCACAVLRCVFVLRVMLCCVVSCVFACRKQEQCDRGGFLEGQDEVCCGVPQERGQKGARAHSGHAGSDRAICDRRGAGMRVVQVHVARIMNKVVSLACSCMRVCACAGEWAGSVLAGGTQV